MNNNKDDHNKDDYDEDNQNKTDNNPHVEKYYAYCGNVQ